MAVKRGDEVQSLQGGPEDGQVAHDLHSQQPGFGVSHPDKLPTDTIPGNHPKHERTTCQK